MEKESFFIRFLIKSRDEYNQDKIIPKLRLIVSFVALCLAFYAVGKVNFLSNVSDIVFLANEAKFNWNNGGDYLCYESLKNECARERTRSIKGTR